jgi:hypothetical protein
MITDRGQQGARWRTSLSRVLKEVGTIDFNAALTG